MQRRVSAPNMLTVCTELEIANKHEKILSKHHLLFNNNIYLWVHDVCVLDQWEVRAVLAPICCKQHSMKILL